MDERVEKALEFSNYMQTLNNQKRILKERYFEERVCYYNGGKFDTTKELLTFVNMMLEKGSDELVLIDDNDIPVKISNIDDFLQELMNSYFQAANRYYEEFDKLRMKRSVEKMVDYEQQE